MPNLSGAQLLLIQRWRDEIVKDKQAIAQYQDALKTVREERTREYYLDFIANHRQHQREMEALIRAHGVEA